MKNPVLMRNKDISPSVSGAHEATTFHGVNGIWGTDCGLDRGIISMFVQPFGILQYLPAVPTRYDIIRIGAITGFQPGTQDEPDKICDDAPTGMFSTCRLQFDLGTIKRCGEDTEYIEAMRRLHRGDEEFILSGILGNDSALGGLSTSLFRGTSPQSLNYPTYLQIHSIANNLALEMGRMVWEGDPSAPAPANTPGGGKKSFTGFNGLVREGYVDAVNTNNECPTMDSFVVDFEFQDVCSGEITLGGKVYNLINLLQAVALRNEMLARDSFLMQNAVQGVIVMAEPLWQQLTECYACQYNLNNCTSNIVLNDGFTVRERDAMREGMYIRLNGKIYVVVTDNGITVLDETSAPDDLDAGERASDIYYIPLTVRGMAVTFMRYLDYRFGAPELDVADAWTNGVPMFTWTDDGKYILTRQWVETCYKYCARIHPGLVLRTPQLAWRINNVKWTDAIPFRNPYPDSPDFVIDSPLV